MRYFYQSLTLYGQVVEVDPARAAFALRTRGGDEFRVNAGPNTWFTVLTNLDNLDRDRVADPTVTASASPGSPGWNVAKYVRKDQFLTVQGVFQENEDKRCLEARTVLLPHSRPDRYSFEETHWWISQISLMADKWLDDLFDSTRSYKIDDFAKFYRTNLNITGGPTNDTVQECATLSRLIYGLSSAFLLTGSERYFLAARAGVQYQREAYRSLSHDGKFCFWAFGRRPGVDGSKLVIPSENPDDRNTIPLYEQIYALAGLAQFYRITQDNEVLEDIQRTVNAFMSFYHDGEEERAAKGFPGLGGFFSHLDCVTMRPDSAGLGANQSRKNWNSVGDHIPAYLVNLILALDPLPRGAGNSHLGEFLDVCRRILDETSRLIVEKFPDAESDYVNERFFADWKPDHSWGWQQNRAIVGHNLKIAWNLTRVAFYYQFRAKSADGPSRQRYTQHAENCLLLAKNLANRMAEVGLDRQRGGIFDAVERRPGNGMPTEFSWMPTKDFWQQEQGILAFLVLCGADCRNPRWRELARESAFFWNCFFLDRDRQGIFFRTSENGDPIIRGSYANKGGHSISGYHAFELNYLAHIYTRAFLCEPDQGCDNNFCLYFHLAENCGFTSINVLPDFLPPERVKINRVQLNGIDRTDELRPNAVDDFQIQLKDGMTGGEIDLAVEFTIRS